MIDPRIRDIQACLPSRFLGAEIIGFRHLLNHDAIAVRVVGMEGELMLSMLDLGRASTPRANRAERTP